VRTKPAEMADDFLIYGQDAMIARAARWRSFWITEAAASDALVCSHWLMVRSENVFTRPYTG